MIQFKSLPWQLSEFRLLKLKKGSKVPVEKWGSSGKTYNYEDPELLTWLSQGGNYGVMAGQEHMIIATDYGVIERICEAKLPPTFTVRSPRHKTKHFYYSIDKPLSRTITCISGPEGDPVADVRHGNSFVVGPGSFFEGYGFYEIVDDLPLTIITEEELIKALEGFIRTRPIQEDLEPVEGKGITFPITKLLEAVGVNNLDVVGNELAGPHPVHGSTTGRNFHVNISKNIWFCFRASHESGGGPLELLAVLKGLVRCEDCRKPSPLKTDKDLFKRVLEEARKLGLTEAAAQQEEEEDKEGRKSQANHLVEIGLTAELFVDDEDEPYAAFSVSAHKETWPIRSRRFKRWLAGEFYNATQKAPNTDALNQALGVLEAKAVFEGGRKRLCLRVAEYDGAFWYDLGDPEWRAVKITPSGWEVVKDPPILFKRYQNTGAQVVPEDGGDLMDVFRFVNINGGNRPNGNLSDDKILMACTIPALLVPDIPKPIWNMYGEKGAAKTDCHKILRGLIDPALEPVFALRRDERELAIQLAHNFLPVFDNISDLTTWQSDMLCRAATGGGFTTRALYTDEEERLFKILRAILINGVHLLSGGTDLQDRFLSTELERIPKAKRRSEKEIFAEFECLKPLLFGAVLTALSKAMAIKPNIRLTDLPRMADFAIWGAAVAEALGIGKDNFLAAYWRNIGQINERILESHPVAAAVMALLEEMYEWEASPASTLAKLEEVASAQRINIRSPSWPKSATALSRRLKEVISNFADVGVEITIGKDRAGKRFIRFQKKRTKCVKCVNASNDDRVNGATGAPTIGAIPSEGIIIAPMVTAVKCADDESSSNDGDSKGGGAIGVIPPILLDEVCLTCGCWQGSEHTEMAFCTEKGDTTRKDFTCNKWQPRPPPGRTMLRGGLDHD